MEEFLVECWRYTNKDAAYGVDEMSAREYEENLEENIRDLVGRLKRKSYRAKLVRRHYIPKGDGRMRPLGIPAVEDKMVQLAVARILEEIWGYDFAGNGNVLDVYIGYLRTKTEAGGEPRLIQTVRGVGYVLREDA